MLPSQGRAFLKCYWKRQQTKHWIAWKFFSSLSLQERRAAPKHGCQGEKGNPLVKRLLVARHQLSFRRTQIKKKEELTVKIKAAILKTHRSRKQSPSWTSPWPKLKLKSVHLCSLTLIPSFSPVYGLFLLWLFLLFKEHLFIFIIF